MSKTVERIERLSMSKKNADKKKWYKDRADDLDSQHSNLGLGFGEISEYKRMKVNYDLFNNVLNLADFEYVCKPYGSEIGELPAEMINRDISSGKIKAILGMEMKRPFSWNAVAVNAEATTRREQEEFNRIREYVISQALGPIRQQIEIQKQQETAGTDLTPDQIRAIQEEVEMELQAQTPDEVRRYIQREHQDPSEVLSNQLLHYLTQKCDLKRKFNSTFKHALLSAKGIMYVGILNGEPEVWVTNSLRFNYDKSPDLDFVEDAESASCEYRMSPSEVIKYFGDQLTSKEIDDVYNLTSPTLVSSIEHWLADTADTGSTYNFDDHYINTVRVLHTVWKSLRKIGFLSYYDENDEVQEMIVDENYRLNEEQGDIDIEWEWIPEVYETWKIGDKIYVNMRPVPGQFKDIDNLYNCKLPYYGAIYDNMNSQETSLMDRLKVYQYYYNIVMYRLELLLASDKGKKVLMNMNMIPDSAGIDLKKWQYFFESTPFMWYDPNEEGTNYADANSVAKVIDLSLVSDIQKYIEIAEYLRNQAGRSVGITDAVEGQIGPNDAVSNTRQSLVQSSHILEPYFDVHATVKRNVLQALLEMAKIAYANSNKKKLTYILDDMSREVIDLDIAKLEDNTIGIFVTNSAKAEENKDFIRQLSHAAMQNQKAELSDILTILRQESIVEAEETLKAAEAKRNEIEARNQQATIEAQQKAAEQQREFVREEHAMELEKIDKEYDRKEELEIIKGSLVGASFNPEQDADRDGINDFIEIAKNGLDADIKTRKQDLDERKFEQQKKVDAQNKEIEEKKLKVAQAKEVQKT